MFMTTMPKTRRSAATIRYGMPTTMRVKRYAYDLHPNFLCRQMVSQPIGDESDSDAVGGTTTTDPNIYGYVGGNPVSLTDPTGEIVPLVAAGAIAGALFNYAIYAATTPTHTVQGALGAALGGAIGGGLGVVAAPVAGTLGLGTGIAGATAVNAFAGLAGNAIAGGLDPCQDLTAGYLASSAAFGALGGYVGSKLFPTVGMSNFAQVGFPRTWSGVTHPVLGGTAGPNAMNAIYTGGSVSVGLGAVGPVYVQ